MSSHHSGHQDERLIAQMYHYFLQSLTLSYQIPYQWGLIWPLYVKHTLIISLFLFTPLHKIYITWYSICLLFFFSLWKTWDHGIHLFVLFSLVVSWAPRINTTESHNTGWEMAIGRLILVQKEDKENKWCSVWIANWNYEVTRLSLKPQEAKHTM